MKRRTISFRLAAAVGALAFTACAAENSGRRGAEYFTNTELTTQFGTKVHFYDDLLKGKIVVINLFYTECKYSCPLETARLAQVQRLLGDRVGKDIFFYSISIDPRKDTPAELMAYAKNYRAGPGWLFLTGTRNDVDILSKKIGLFSEPDPADRDGHTPYVLLGNEATGQWMRNSATDNPRRLALVIGDWLNSWKTAQPGKSFADVPDISPKDKGKHLFASYCGACHSIGQGDQIGPDLLGVAAVRDRAWLRRFIATPDQMLAEKDPAAIALFEKFKRVTMPNLNLDPADLDEVIAFMNSQSRAPRAEAASPKEKPGATKAQP